MKCKITTYIVTFVAVFVCVVLLPSFVKTVENGYTWLIWLTSECYEKDGCTHS